MQKCNKNVENGVKNIQPVNQSLVLLMGSAFLRNFEIQNLNKH